MNTKTISGAALFVGLIIALIMVAGPSVAFGAQSTQTYYWGPWVPTYTQPIQTQYQYQNQYQYQYQYQYQQIQYLLQLIAQLQAFLDARDIDDDFTFGDSEIDITTLSATDIDDDRARLRGEVDFNSSDHAYVWFEWGEDNDDLDEDTPRIRRDDDDDEQFSVTITDLDDDTRYYFRALGEDEDGRIDRGSIRNFTTDDSGGSSSDDNEPDVETEEADRVTDDSARIHGTVDMNDFNNGRVFFVYGEDEDQVDEIADDYDTYSDVDEDGDDLQKILVDSDLDGDASYTASFSGLNDNTDIFYAICVEFEDEDDDDKIICGDTESFETD